MRNCVNDPSSRRRQSFTGAPLAMCAALAVMVIGQRAASANDWTDFGLSQTRSRLSIEQSGTAFGAATWTYQLPAVQDQDNVYRALIASPAIADGFVVFGTSERSIRALREQDGRLVWEFAVGDAVHASPAIHSGLVYAAALNRQLYALRIDTGQLVWKRDLGGLAYSSPVVTDGSVFVAVGNPSPRVFRLDPGTGAIEWEAGGDVLQQAAHASVAVAGGHVLVGEMEGRVHGFSAGTGALEWTTDTGGTLNLSSPLVIDDRAYLLPGGDEHRLFAIDVATGTAVPGWPIAVDMPEDVITGNRMVQVRTVSSPAGSGNGIVFDLRLDEQIDTDLDGIAETWVLREFTVGVDPAAARVAWTNPNGRVVTVDPNRIPTYGLCPVPALYASTGARTLVATASTLSPRLRVLDLSTGAERWSTDLSGPTRGSPAMANGRLFVGTDAGVVHAFLSDTNQPPGPPMAGFFPADGQQVDSVSVALRWRAAFDSEADTLTYQIRYDSDGEVLRSWAGQVTTTAGQVSARLDHLLLADRTYTYAIRSRDPRGAWSAWSALQRFETVVSPPVSINGRGFETLAAAIGGALPGETIVLGKGTYHIAQTVRLPSGVNFAGAGPHLTIVDAAGPGVGITVDNGLGAQIRGMTVSHGSIAVNVDGGHEVELRNVILRDNAEVGLEVGASGSARLINATVLANGIGVRAFGRTEVRNTLITGNETGMRAPDPTVIVSHYNDIFANRTVDLDNVPTGLGDISLVVHFQTDDRQDVRLQPQQASTDHGAPTDSFEMEPIPNGGRVNIGAFGNTPFAELSAVSVASTAVGAVPPSVPTPISGSAATSTGTSSSTGCACGLASSSPPSWLTLGGGIWLALLVARARARARARRQVPSTDSARFARD